MYIKVYDCIAPNGYNYKGGGANGKYSEISKTKLSESLSGENSPWFGRKHTEEWKENIRYFLQEDETGERRNS